MNAVEQGALTAEYDPETQIIYLRGHGVWDMAILARHKVEVEIAFSQARRDGHNVLILADISKSAVQPQAIATELSAFIERHYRVGDRIAVIVETSLTKMQMRRVAGAATIECFMSPSAAMMWLLAHKEQHAA